MNAEHSLFDGPDDGKAERRARAEIEAGKGVPHEDVAKWLDTWGTKDFKPMPREWLE